MGDATKLEDQAAELAVLRPLAAWAMRAYEEHAGPIGDADTTINWELSRDEWDQLQSAYAAEHEWDVGAGRPKKLDWMSKAPELNPVYVHYRVVRLLEAATEAVEHRDGCALGELDDAQMAIYDGSSAVPDCVYDLCDASEAVCCAELGFENWPALASAIAAVEAHYGIMPEEAA